MNPDAKILVVDDMLTMRRLVKLSLNSLGYNQVALAKDGEDAWEQLDKANSIGSPYQLILCDWNMPGMNGIQLLEKIRASSQMHRTTFVMLTANSEIDQIKVASQKGVDGYMTKPFQGNQLQEVLRKLKF
jgi:two-component system, chemotaxis family, chemotaxis protein CheY